MTHTELDQVIAGDTDIPLCPVAEIIDMRQLRDRCLGNQQLVDRILLKLDGTLEGELRAIHAAMLQDDFLALATTAHRLKGTAANVGAEPLREVAQQLETCARHQQRGETEACYDRLEVERHRLCEAIAVIRNAPSSENRG